MVEVVRAGVTLIGRPHHRPTAMELAGDIGTYRLPRRNVPIGAHTAMMKGGTRHPLTHLDIETGILEMIDLLIGTPQEVKEVITNAIIETLHLEIIITEGEVLEIWSIPVLDKNMITAEINAVTALRIDMDLKRLLQ